MVGGWKEGVLCIETCETEVVEAQDWIVARTIAALVGTGAPGVQNAVLLWQDDEDGPDVVVAFRAVSDDAA